MTDMQWVNEGFFRQQRVREQGGLADGRERRAARRPRRAHVPSRAVRALPQPRLPDRPARSDSGHVRRPRQHPAGRTSASGSRSRRFSTRASARGRTAATSTTATARSPCRPTSRACPPDEQVRALDRASLESCLGGAFHPGIEAPWTLRSATMWERPFRMRVRSTEPKVDYGPMLTRDVVFAKKGPLQGSAPGELTGWLGVPVAQRRGQLPFRLPAAHLHRPPHVLARADPEPGAARGRLPDRDGSLAAAGGAAGGVPRGGTTGSGSSRGRRGRRRSS